MFQRRIGAIELGLRCPQNVNGIAADPQPDWSFDKLLWELDSIDKKLNLILDFPSAFTKTQTRDVRASRDNHSCARGFVMHVSDDESSYTDGDSEEEAENSPMVPRRRFACDEPYMRCERILWDVIGKYHDCKNILHYEFYGVKIRLSNASLSLSLLIGSDDSEDAIPLGMQCHLMDKVGLAEIALVGLTHELQLNVSHILEAREKVFILLRKILRK